MYAGKPHYLKLRFLNLCRPRGRRTEYAKRSTKRPATMRRRMLWDIALLGRGGDLSDAHRTGFAAPQERLAEAMEERREPDEEIGGADAGAARGEKRLHSSPARRAIASKDPETQQAQGRHAGECLQGPARGPMLQDALQRPEGAGPDGRGPSAFSNSFAKMMENMQVTQVRSGPAEPRPAAMEGLAENASRAQRSCRTRRPPTFQEQSTRARRPPSKGQQQGQGQQGEGPQPGEGQGQNSEQQFGEGPGTANRSTRARDRNLANRVQGQGFQPKQGTGGGNRRPHSARMRQELRRQTEEPGRRRHAGRRRGARESGRAGDAIGSRSGGGLCAKTLRRPRSTASRKPMRRSRGACEIPTDQMARKGQQQPGQDGSGPQAERTPTQRDPLGREAGRKRRVGTDEELTQSEEMSTAVRGKSIEEIRRPFGRTARGRRNWITSKALHDSSRACPPSFESCDMLPSRPVSRMSGEAQDRSRF